MTNAIGSDFAGHINVRLLTLAGQVSAVKIDSTRPRGVAKVFAGRTPEETVGLLGRVFSLCAMAQTVAGLEALEDACGVNVAAPHRAARDILREAEMLTQTLLRVCMDWPRVLDMPPAVEVARAALSAQAGLEADLFDGQNWKVIGGVAMSPDEDALRTRLCDLQDVVAKTFDPGGLAETLVAALDRRGLNGFGALGEGVAPESGALSRHWNDADVAAARIAFGAGLRARLLARFADMRSLPVSLLNAVGELHPCSGREFNPNANGAGTATVETARGALTHTVSVKDGKISTYVIDAPTDLNFLNDGVVATGLLGAAAVDPDALNAAAELHVLAVDPCVRCTLEVRNA
ncbi:hypothetical protein [Magnetovibrio sp.]|uniref:hypothetical protein n=1 Tax=Magnetovibrio sp. TaxID=2024836 RepID=UPI002F922748